MSHRITKPNTESDNLLQENLSAANPLCFVMVAGAGSGKTTSLVKALDFLRRQKGGALKRSGQKIACITYTETAEKEVLQDIGSDNIFHVSTIHSFLWLLIKPFQVDISEWVLSRIATKVAKHQEDIAKPRVQEKTKVKARAEIAKLEASIDSVKKVKRYTYSTGSDYESGILGHEDILKMVPELILSKPLLRAIVAAQFPYIFVDESQDTMPAVVEALLAVQSDAPKEVCIGFFGDPMQKIYMHGVGDINNDKWIRIEKAENFRCPATVLSVINNIRVTADGLEQQPGLKERTPNGSAKLFVVPADEHRTARLDDIRQRLSKEHNDPLWLDNTYKHVKVLVLVHRMAAQRLGFENLYSAIHDHDETESLKNGLLDGSMWVGRPFFRLILPLYFAVKINRNFEIISILRANSPAFTGAVDRNDNLAAMLKETQDKVTQLVSYIDNENTSIGAILNFVHDAGLFALDERMLEYLSAYNDGLLQVSEEEGGIILPSRKAVGLFFDCSIKEILNCHEYVNEQSPFRTQQGIKGAEFERVLTILDDELSDYNLFSYGKYFRITPLSAKDEQNIEEGKDSVISRTQRLFYVSCSRATKDLAVVFYTNEPERAYEKILEASIFPPEDVILLTNVPAALN